MFIRSWGWLSSPEDTVMVVDSAVDSITLSRSHGAHYLNVPRPLQRPGN